MRNNINEYAETMRRHMNLKNEDFDLNSVIDSFKDSLSKELGIDEETIANYVIKTSYNSFSISKSFAWSAYGEYIIENLKNNTNPKKRISLSVKFHIIRTVHMNTLVSIMNLR